MATGDTRYYPGAQKVVAARFFGARIAIARCQHAADTGATAVAAALEHAMRFDSPTSAAAGAGNALLHVAQIAAAQKLPSRVPIRPSFGSKSSSRLVIPIARSWKAHHQDKGTARTTQAGGIEIVPEQLFAGGRGGSSLCP